jgi:predicted MFS family arabinose efflux permease
MGSPPISSSEHAPHPNLRLISITLAAACGLSVANIYYAQPLLTLIASSFHVSQGTATIVVTATQFGYALGVALLMPLGDLLENRRLATATMLGTAVALLAAAFAPTLTVFLAVSVLVGITSVVAQILVPFAANLAPPAQRGQFVGRVMSGLLLGILLARTASSLAAGAWGWRSIYVISAGLMLALAVAVRLVLPTRRPQPGVTYRQLLRSVARLAAREPVLRQRTIAQMLMFAAFSAFWTVVAYQLIDVKHLSQQGVGIFALVGAGGALAAPVAGRLADAGHGRGSRGVTVVLAAGGLVLAAVLSHSLIALAAGAVLLDLACQGGQVLSQRDIYALSDDARSRINTVFIGTIFVGGAASSAIAGLLHETLGWTATMIYAASLPALSGVIMLSRHWRRVQSGLPDRSSSPVSTTS